ncbi:MAG: hypothetical protein K9G67_15550 [Bacteroidales bacterium]|nr:hypothetical protein [Bacteroidales bacterium]MCF8377771.1 hypothetical protein [Bacteroidales bacterium]
MPVEKLFPATKSLFFDSWRNQIWPRVILRKLKTGIAFIIFLMAIHVLSALTSLFLFCAADHRDQFCLHRRFFHFRGFVRVADDRSFYPADKIFHDDPTAC